MRIAALAAALMVAGAIVETARVSAGTGVFLITVGAFALLFAGRLPEPLRPRNLFASGLALMALSLLIDPAMLDRRPEDPVAAALGIPGFFLALIAPVRWVLARLDMLEKR